MLYKVVGKFQGVFCSSMTVKHGVAYRLNEWTVAPFGGLFAFDTESSARKYVSLVGYVLECEADGLMPAPAKVATVEGDFEQLWVDPKQCKEPLVPPLPGTIVARRLKPIRVL